MGSMIVQETTALTQRAFAAFLAVVALNLHAQSKLPPVFDLPSEVDAQRAYYLGNIDLLRDYRPGKNACVESPERRLGYHQAPGSRFTLLELTGAGSIRHLWTTFQPGKGDHRLHFYLNGDTAPTFSGTPAELIDRAQKDAAVPVPGFVARNYGYNLLAPVDFTNGARIEMETIDPVWILFHQIDYRTDVRSAPPDQKMPRPAAPPRRESARVTIPPGETAARAATIQFSHDDPVRVLVNGEEVYCGETHRGFATVNIPVNFNAGKNEVVVQLVNQFNVNFNWAGFGWRELAVN